MEPNNPTSKLSPDQYSQQPISEQPGRQKGFLLPIIGVILLIVIVSSGAYYLGRIKSTTSPKIEKVTPTLQPSSTVSPISPTIDPTTNWKVYKNTIYKFELRYPSNWSLKEKTTEVSPDFVVFQSPNEFDLGISFKQKGDKSQLAPSGISAGDFVNRGNTKFADITVSKDVLVYKGNDKAIWYNHVSEFTVGDIVFFASLNNRSIDYEGNSFNKETEQIADQILSSFKFIQ